MGARLEKFAGIVQETVKDLFSNNFSSSSVIADNEVLEDGYVDAKGNQTNVSISDSATNVDIKAKDEGSRIYGGANKFTGSSYDDSKKVEFAISDNVNFGKKPTNENPYSDSYERALASSHETNRVTENANKRTVVDYAYSFSEEPVQASGKKTIVLKDLNAANSITVGAKANDGAQALKNAASIGFGGNTVTTRNSIDYQPNDSFDTQSFSPMKTTIGGSGMGSSPIQLLTPSDINEANQLGELLNAGNTVLVMLTNIKDKTARIRYSDYMTGCCGGCGATFKVIVPVESPDSVLLAAPKGVRITLPKTIAQQQAQYQQPQFQQTQYQQPVQQPTQSQQRPSSLPTFTPDDLFRVDETETTDLGSFKFGDI